MFHWQSSIPSWPAPPFSSTTASPPTSAPTWPPSQMTNPTPSHPHPGQIQGPPPVPSTSPPSMPSGSTEHLFGHPSELQTHWTSRSSTSAPTFPPTAPSHILPTQATSMTPPPHHGPPPHHSTATTTFPAFRTPLNSTTSPPVWNFCSVQSAPQPIQPAELPQLMVPQPCHLPTPTTAPPPHQPAHPRATAVKAAPKRPEKARRDPPPREADPRTPNPLQLQVDSNTQNLTVLGTTTKEMQHQEFMESQRHQPPMHTFTARTDTYTDDPTQRYTAYSCFI